METKHDSVLLAEAIDSLAVAAGDTVVDATLGGAGHFRALLGKLGPQGTLVGIDADGDAVGRARAAEASVREETGSRATVVIAHDNFRNLSTILDEAGIDTIDKALFDLGWSSFHLSSGRGFSFKTDEPLLMTYGEPGEGVETAADIVNTAPEETLADIFFTYGEERFSRQIAKSIAQQRKQKQIITTHDLVRAIEAGTPSWYQHRKIHPATKVFQALRIAVNDEFGALRDGLSAALARLSIGGRVAVITFHSIEDRIVKTMLRDAVQEGYGSLVAKKPLVPSAREQAANPRSRSAKLRVFERGGASPKATPVRINNIFSYL